LSVAAIAVVYLLAVWEEGASWNRGIRRAWQELRAPRDAIWRGMAWP
jgi:hypothetical protein